MQVWSPSCGVVYDGSAALRWLSSLPVVDGDELGPFLGRWVDETVDDEVSESVDLSGREQDGGEDGGQQRELPHPLHHSVGRHPVQWPQQPLQRQLHPQRPHKAGPVHHTRLHNDRRAGTEGRGRGGGGRGRRRRGGWEVLLQPRLYTPLAYTTSRISTRM